MPRTLGLRKVETPAGTLSRMSSSTTTDSQKSEWIIILPDHPGVLQKRQQVRPDHLCNLKPNADAGLWTFGGAFSDDHPPAGEAPNVKGSVMLAYADSKEQVLEELKKDVYCTSGVWDWDKVQIYAFRSALRRGMEGGL